MRQTLRSTQKFDSEGNPAGGITEAEGLEINWQDGPLGRGEDRKQPNGCFVETVILAAIDRLEFYQNSKFRCDANKQTIAKLNEALRCLEARTADREARDVEGTHDV
jgi:hypothetical protein